MATFVPPKDWVIHETEHWWVNHRCDTRYPGYLMVGAKDPGGVTLADLSLPAQSELGPLLARSSALLQESLGAIHVYNGRFGHAPGHTVHFHVIPIYEWTVSAYLGDERYRVIRETLEMPSDIASPMDFDGADMTLFVWRTFAGPGVEPPPTDCPSVEDVVTRLRREF